MKKCSIKIWAFMVIAFFLMNVSSASLAAGSTSAISADKTSVTLETGKMHIGQITLKNASARDLTISNENDRIAKGIFLVDGGSEVFFINAYGPGKTSVRISLKSNPKVFVDINVTVKPNYEERMAINSVKHINDCDFFYYEREKAYVLCFSLQDQYRTRIKAPVTVDIKIIDTDNNTLYEDTCYITMKDFATWNSGINNSTLLASVYIEPSEIKNNKDTFYATVKFTVKTDYWHFAEEELITTELFKW